MSYWVMYKTILEVERLSWLESLADTEYHRQLFHFYKDFSWHDQRVPLKLLLSPRQKVMILKTELRHEKVRQDLDVKKSKNKTTIYWKNKIDLIFDFFDLSRPWITTHLQLHLLLNIKSLKDSIGSSKMSNNITFWEMTHIAQMPKKQEFLAWKFKLCHGYSCVTNWWCEY